MKNKRYHKKNNVRTILIFIQALLFFVMCPFVVYGDEENIENEIIDLQTESGEIKSIGEGLERYKHSDIDEILTGYNPKNMVNDLAKGKLEFDMLGVFNRLLAYLFKEFYLNINILIKLVVLISLCAILNNLQSSFLNKGTGELAFYVCYMVLVSILIASFGLVVESGISTIDKMVDFMYASVPVLITLLVSSGNVVSGGALQPLLIMAVQISATIMKTMLIPLIVLSTVVSIVDNISDKIQIKRFAEFLKNIAQWSLGAILTVFVAVVSLQGSLGAVVDGVTSKTTKFAINTFVPVVGKYLADAADVVIGCTLLIKNAVGIAIMIGIIGVCLIPIVQMLSIVFIYKITCVLVEPLADKRLVKCISEVASSMMYILGVVTSVAFMFLITITALVLASNISTMIR